MEEWERDAFELLSPLRENLPDPRGEGRVVDQSLERIKESIGASDFVEFATTVLVAEFLGPILDVFAFALGLEDEITEPRDESKATER